MTSFWQSCVGLWILFSYVWVTQSHHIGESWSTNIANLRGANSACNLVLTKWWDGAMLKILWYWVKFLLIFHSIHVNESLIGRIENIRKSQFCLYRFDSIFHSILFWNLKRGLSLPNIPSPNKRRYGGDKFYVNIRWKQLKFITRGFLGYNLSPHLDKLRGVRMGRLCEYSSQNSLLWG